MNMIVRSRYITLIRGLQQRSYVRLTNIDETQLDFEILKTRIGEAVSVVPVFEHWNANLASTSEAIVKAEQAPAKSFVDMQEETITIITELEKEKLFPMRGTLKDGCDPSTDAPIG
jgi:hypothetical protein